MEAFIQEKDIDLAIDGIRRLVAQPSYLQEAVQGAPFGQDVLDALKECLSLFAEEGFDTFIDPEGYYGYAEIGEGDETLAVLCHLDVVPAMDEEAWSSHPFRLEIRNGEMYGRGTQDDKGPTVATLYALKAVLNKGYQLNKKIRFIFGTDEENFWRCMERYNKIEAPADLGFAPDGSFPLIYAEKGLWQAEIVSHQPVDFKISGGHALNVVPAEAIYEGNKASAIASYLNEGDYELHSDKLVVFGESVHSKDAPEGKNAILILAEAMGHVYDDPMIQFLAHFSNDGHGTSIFGDVYDEASGRLTMNVATIEVTEDGLKVGIDLREPVTIDHGALCDTLQKALQKAGLEYQYVDYLDSLYVPKDSELVQTLMDVYRDVTGSKTEPMVSGGATFARTMKHCVAFGAMLETTEETEHQVDEHWALRDMAEAMEIYAQAFYRLVTK